VSRPDLTLLTLGALTAAQYAELEGDEQNPFDVDGKLQWSEGRRHVALAEPDGRLVAATAISSAAATVDGLTLPLLGIGGVIVRAERRGEGLARAIVLAALEQPVDNGARHALLFCWPDRAGLYTRLGFTTVEDQVTIAQPNGRVTMHMQTMWRGLTPAATWPPGPVALEGLPF
jgi:predicted N-acetyltransferase YhbS